MEVSISSEWRFPSWTASDFPPRSSSLPARFQVLSTTVRSSASGPGGSTQQPRVEASLCAPGDASTQKHCQSCDGAQAGRSLVLDVAEWMCVLSVARVRFVRGTARYRTWCEVECRALD